MDEEDDQTAEPVLGYMFDRFEPKTFETLDGVTYACSRDDDAATAMQSGHSVWSGCGEMMRYLGTQEVRGKEICELGCGVGVVGLACAMRGAKRVQLTDRDPGALELCRLGIDANDVAESVTTERIVFGDVVDDQFDLVLASDVIYDRDMAYSVCATAASLLRPAGSFLLGASFDLGPEFLTEFHTACDACSFTKPTVVRREGSGRIWRTWRKQTRTSLIDEVARKVAGRSPFVLEPRRFLAAFSGAIVLAFKGWPVTVTRLKEAIEDCELPRENLGSQWPKITLGASVTKLSLTDLQDLNKILADASQFSDNCWIVNTLHLTVYASGSHENLIATRSVSLEGGPAATVEPDAAARVDKVIHESTHDLSTYLDAFNGSLTQSNADRYTCAKPGASLVAFLHDDSDSTLLRLIARLRQNVEAVLPRRFRWFDDAALHATLRALY